MSKFNLLSTRDQTLSDSRWDAFVASHPDGHLLQTSRWAALKGRFGWRVERVALARQGQIVAGGQVLLRRLPWGQALAYAAKGPIVDWRQASQVRPLLEGLRAAIAPHRPALLKLEPDLADSPLLELLFQSYGLRRGHGVQPRSTIHVDLSQGLDAALAGMKQKWRYNIRLASRKEVIVRPGQAADLAAWQRLNEETSRRDGFAIHTAAYYQAAFELFTKDDTARWLLAEYKGELLGAIVVFALGRKSWYIWGASSDAERQRMPNHALQWAGMAWAAERGCQTYDFWGIPDEVGADPQRWSEDFSGRQGGLWGVYRFKQGFGGQIVRYTGAWDLPLSSWGYRLYDGMRRLRGQSRS